MEKDKQLLGKRDGTTISQAPFQMPTDNGQFVKPDDHAISRTKKPKLKRRHAQQQINKFIRQGASVPRDLEAQAARPSKKSRR